MDISKNYYLILNVLPDAEEVVVRAAYRALAQRYHPDKWHGNIEAEQRMAQINEAYGVLSDPKLRQQYDEARKEQKVFAEGYEDELQWEEVLNSNEILNQDWDLAESIYPDLKDISARLKRISSSLFEMFKVYLLEKKQFIERHQIAVAYEDYFLSRYFGDSKKLKDFAIELIFSGKREAALSLNKMVRILGTSDPEPLMTKIRSGFLSDGIRQDYERFKLNNDLNGLRSLEKGGALICGLNARGQSVGLCVGDVIINFMGFDVRGKTENIDRLRRGENSQKSIPITLIRKLNLIDLIIPPGDIGLQISELS